MADCRLRKQERLCSRTLAAQLFEGGQRKSISVYPLRAVFLLTDTDAGAPAQLMVSVSKRHFKRAVKRNRAKRQIREAYRRNKHLLDKCLAAHQGRTLLIALLWLSDDLLPSAKVDEAVVRLLKGISERV